MSPEQADRMLLGWSPAYLASVSVASVYVIEGLSSAGTENDARIRRALDQGIAIVTP